MPHFEDDDMEAEEASSQTETDQVDDEVPLDEEEDEEGEESEEMEEMPTVGDEDFDQKEGGGVSPYPEPGDIECPDMHPQENSDPEEEKDMDYLDYSCEICEVTFVYLNDLFKHLESHDADQYAFSSEKPVSITAAFGDPSEAQEARKWPSRFLKFPSEVFLTLTQFQEGQTPADQRGSTGAGESALYNGEGSRSGDLNGGAMKPRNQLAVTALMNRLRMKFPFKKPLGVSLLAKRTKKFKFLRYKCPHCGKEFQRSDHFKAHLANHNNNTGMNTMNTPFPCKFCGKGFNALVILRKHMETHPAYKPYKCSKCPRRFNQLALLKRHEESPFVHTDNSLTTESPRRCRLCFEMFANDKTRLEHERRVHGTNRPTAVFRCRYPSCRRIQPSLKVLAEHYRKNHAAQGLLEDNESMSNEKPSQAFHQQNGNTTDVQPPLQSSPSGSEECRMCFTFLPSISERNFHEHSVHDINNPQTVLQCKYEDCRKVLGAKNWLARHIREHRQRINEGKDPSHESMEQTQQQQGDASSEGEWEEEEEPWDCRLCDQRFLEEAERASHEKHLHDTGNPTAEFLCKLCSTEVGNFCCLLIHVESHHQNQTPAPKLKVTPKGPSNLIFPCRHCDIVFNDQQIRLTHEYDVHDTKDALDNFYPCKICGKVMTLRGLRKHLRRIHGESPCMEGTPNQGGPRPPADQESSNIPSKQALHSATPVTHHPSKASQPKPVQPASNVVYKRSSEPSRAAWVCRLCNDQFDEQRQRETHEHSVHGTNAPNATFLCKYAKCELEFGTFRALIKHLRQHGETTFPTGQQKLLTPSATSSKPNTPKGSGSGHALLQNDAKDSLLWRCRLCWEVFPSKQHRLSHEQNFHQTEETTSPLQCKYCPRNFLAMRPLVKHLETHGEGDAEKCEGGAEEGPPTLEPEVPQTPKKPVVCRLCDLDFPHVKARITHEHMVHSTKNMRQEQGCKFCGATLPNFRQLLGHFQSEHKGKGMEVPVSKNPSP